MALVYSMTRKSDPRIGLILAGVFLGCAAVAFVVLALILPGSWVLSLVTDVFLVIPTFPLIIVIAAMAKNTSDWILIAVLVITGWSYGARQLRAQALDHAARG